MADGGIGEGILFFLYILGPLFISVVVDLPKKFNDFKRLHLVENQVV